MTWPGARFFHAMNLSPPCLKRSDDPSGRRHSELTTLRVSTLFPGSLPSELGELTKLTTLNVNKNQLEGKCFLGLFDLVFV